jgi:hypothetical protein
MEEEINKTTKINEKILDHQEEDNISLDDKEYDKYILDLSLKFETRIKLIERYYSENQNNTVELVSRISGMYHFSGTKILEKYLNGIATESYLSSLLKIEAIKGLLSFEEYEEDIDEKDDEELKEIKKESNDAIKERNKIRYVNAYKVLNDVCSSLDDELPTPCKIEIICMLMENPEYDPYSCLYFLKIICDERLECEFRYKTILSLENKKKIININYHLKNSLLIFLNTENNIVLYRILSAQYLLQNKNFNLTNDEIVMIEKILYDFASSEDVEYNLRADASDVILSFGSEEMKLKGQEMIMKLGGGDKIKSVYDNKQNVHVKEIEKSVLVILESICYYNVNTNNEDCEIDFEYVCSKIEELLKDNRENYSHEKIKVSLNRILMDRRLYSTLNLTLSAVLVKLWGYIIQQENKAEMEVRLLEELEEMSGTCSSGFISRLVNVVTGFGDLNIKISFEDQIISNFSGRLNAYARKIQEKDSKISKQKYKDIIKLVDNSDKLDKDEILEEFFSNVLNEMGISCSKYNERPSFLLFFRTYMSDIREEMYKEFKEYISDSEFDLYFRKALSYYDGIRDTI